MYWKRICRGIEKYLEEYIPKGSQWLLLGIFIFMRRSIIKIELEIYPEERKLPRMLPLPPCGFSSTRNLTFSSEEESFKRPSVPLLQKKSLLFCHNFRHRKVAKIVQRNTCSLYPDSPNISILHLLSLSLSLSRSLSLYI